MLYVVKKHCPEEAHLNGWAKRRLIIKKSPEDLIYLLDWTIDCIEHSRIKIKRCN